MPAISSIGARTAFRMSSRPLTASPARPNGATAEAPARIARSAGLTRSGFPSGRCFLPQGGGGTGRSGEEPQVARVATGSRP